MATNCGDTLSLQDLQTAKKHQLFEAEVITGKAGGVAGGADIDSATNQVTGQTQKTLPAVLRDAGFQPASFDFTTGGTLGVNDRDKVVYDPASKTWYSWGGALPHVIAAGTNPVGVADWKPQTDPDLRADLEDPEGATTHPELQMARWRDDGDIRGWGGDITGVTPADDIIESILSTGKSLKIPYNSTILITRPIKYRSQSSIYSTIPQSGYNDGRPAKIYAKRPVSGDSTTWKGGINTCLLIPNAASTQSFTLEGVSIEGWANIVFSSLSTAENIQVHGIDIAGVKDTIKLKDVAFKALSTAIIKNNAVTTNYTDTVMCEDVHINRCYKAIDGLPTVGFIIDGLHIYDCYTWITASRICGSGLVCNNSSFATESTQIYAESIAINGLWIEGGNKVLSSISCIINGGYISETFSASGSSKFIIGLRVTSSIADVQSYSFNGVRMPTNTRLTDGVLSVSYSGLSISLKGCTNAGGSFGASTDLFSYVAKGARYLGESNNLRASETTNKWNSKYNQEFRGIKIDNISGYRVGASGLQIPISFDAAFISSQTPSVQPESMKLIYSGHNDGDGGNIVYTSDITITKGAGNNWIASSSIPEVATVSITPATSGTGATVTVTPVHSGNKTDGCLWVQFCSANLIPSLSASYNV